MDELQPGHRLGVASALIGFCAIWATDWILSLLPQRVRQSRVLAPLRQLLWLISAVVFALTPHAGKIWVRNWALGIERNAVKSLENVRSKANDEESTGKDFEAEAAVCWHAHRSVRERHSAAGRGIEQTQDNASQDKETPPPWVARLLSGQATIAADFSRAEAILPRLRAAWGMQAELPLIRWKNSTQATRAGVTVREVDLDIDLQPYQVRINDRSIAGFTINDGRDSRCSVSTRRSSVKVLVVVGPDYVPPTTATTRRRCVVHYHGGGMVAMSPRGHIDYLIAWAKQLGEVPIVSVDYSLAPEAPFPRAVDECYAALCALHYSPRMQSLVFGFAERFESAAAIDVVLVGDSAGGNLAAVTALQVAERRRDAEINQAKINVDIDASDTITNSTMVLHHPNESRFVWAPTGSAPTHSTTTAEQAFISYKIHSSEEGEFVVELGEAFVPPSLRGQGIAARLARATFQLLLDGGINGESVVGRVVLTCDYLKGQFLNSPTFEHLFAGARFDARAVPMPVGCLLIYPWTIHDAPARTEFVDDMIVPGAVLSLMLPLYFRNVIADEFELQRVLQRPWTVFPAEAPAALLSQFPHCRVVVGARDPLRDDSIHFVDAACAAGAADVELEVLEGYTHGWVGMGGVAKSGSRVEIRRAGQWLKNAFPQR